MHMFTSELQVSVQIKDHTGGYHAKEYKTLTIWLEAGL